MTRRLAAATAAEISLASAVSTDSGWIRVPLNAGTLWNTIQVTYTAEAADEMGGGTVRIDLPVELSAIKGTSMPVRYQNVVIDSEADRYPASKRLYSSTSTALSTFGDNLAVDDTFTENYLSRVKFLDASRVEIMLDKDWDAGGVLTVVLGNVKSPVPVSLPVDAVANDTTTTTNEDNSGPYAEYPVRVSSKRSRGTLTAVGSQSLRVGSIAGTRTAEDNVAGADPVKDTLSTKVEFDPTIVYRGVMRQGISLTFTAPGPIYNSQLNIGIPTGIQPDHGNIRVSSNKPGVGDVTLTPPSPSVAQTIY